MRSRFRCQESERHLRGQPTRRVLLQAVHETFEQAPLRGVSQELHARREVPGDDDRRRASRTPRPDRARLRARTQGPSPHLASRSSSRLSFLFTHLASDYKSTGFRDHPSRVYGGAGAGGSVGDPSSSSWKQQGQNGPSPKPPSSFFFQYEFFPNTSSSSSESCSPSSCLSACNTSVASIPRDRGMTSG